MNEKANDRKECLRQSIAYIREQWSEKIPKTAFICGSGWSEAIKGLKILGEIPFQKIKCLSLTTVEGHKSNLLLVETKTGYGVIFQGRRHFYEGVGWETIRNPIILSKELGCKNVVLTNAAGGISEFLNVGDIMIIEDHINFMGGNPLIGEIPHPLIPRFPDQTEVYSKQLINLAEKIAKKKKIDLKKGIYLGLTGPAFETPAEIRGYKAIGADAVGMSTIPEAMVANALGMRVIAFSCISNKAAGISEEKLSHEEVTENTAASLPTMQSLITHLLSELN